MATTDRERWDAKHRAHEGTPLGAPDPFVLLALERLGENGAPVGRALDLACGRGRHALELARRGWAVEAWDVSAVALAELARHADGAGLTVATRLCDLVGVSGIEALEAAEPVDLALAVDFLDRGVLAALPRVVRPGGYALFTTFTTERPGAKPSLRHCLRPGELERGLPGFETRLAFERGGRAGVLGVRE